MASADFCGRTRCITARRAVWPDGCGPMFSIEIGPLDLAPGRIRYGTTRPSLPSEPHRQGAQISPGKSRELSVHKRRIYRRLRTGRLCWLTPMLGAHRPQGLFLVPGQPPGGRSRTQTACRLCLPRGRACGPAQPARTPKALRGVIAAGAVFLPRHRSAGSWRHRDKHSPPSCPCLSRSWSCPRKRPSCFGCPGRGRWSCQTASSAPAL